MACEPIKDKQKVADVLETLSMRKHHGFRDALLFEFLLSTGLRVSDAISVKKSDIDFLEGALRVYINKTKDHRLILLNKPVLRKLYEYTKDMDDQEILFPFTRQWAHKLLKWGFDQAGLDSQRYSTHTTRKTAGWFFYEESGKDIIKTMYFLGHRNPKECRAYLMISDEEVNSQLKDMTWS